jgi:hypothetical protein
MFHVLLLVSSLYGFATLVLHDVPYDRTHSSPLVVRPASRKYFQVSTCTLGHLFTFRSRLVANVVSLIPTASGWGR